MKHYYLWSGVGAIEDLDDADNLGQALLELRSKTSGSWTLWCNTNGYLAGIKLIAVWIPEKNIYEAF